MKIDFSVPVPTSEAAERASKSHGGTGVREALALVYGSEPGGVDPVIDELQAEALREDW